MSELEIPEFLKNYEEESILQEMLALIPDMYDKSAGQHYYNFVRPTANVVAQLRGFDLPRAIALIWPKYAYGEYLDYHAELRNITRKEAQYATGIVTITGKAETIIPDGYMLSTESKNGVESKDYVTTEQCVIGEDGTVDVMARAIEAGKNGNTAANTIIINTSQYEDVTSVINTNAFIGGVDEETDESLYERIHDFDKMLGDTNVGNPADYKRWAESVSGTGSAKVVRATDNSGLVKIILTDGNNEPATDELCEKVYNYIMSPNDDSSRLAPCGANLLVTPPTTFPITIRANVELSHGTILEITEKFIVKLKEYFSEAIEDKELLYQRVCRVLSSIDGVYDYSALYVNDAMKNIAIDEGIFPTIDTNNVIFTQVDG